MGSRKKLLTSEDSPLTRYSKEEGVRRRGDGRWGGQLPEKNEEKKHEEEVLLRKSSVL